MHICGLLGWQGLQDDVMLHSSAAGYLDWLASVLAGLVKVCGAVHWVLMAAVLCARKQQQA
jgi:hypothetical protein